MIVSIALVERMLRLPGAIYVVEDDLIASPSRTKESLTTVSKENEPHINLCSGLMRTSGVQLKPPCLFQPRFRALFKLTCESSLLSSTLCHSETPSITSNENSQRHVMAIDQNTGKIDNEKDCSWCAVRISTQGNSSNMQETFLATRASLPNSLEHT